MLLSYVILILTVLFINSIYYYTTNKYSKFENGHLFLVKIPDEAYQLSEVKMIIQNFKNELFKIFILSFILYLPIFIIPDFFKIIYFLIVIWINLLLVNYPLKKYRHQLLLLKRNYHWPNQKIKTVKIDLKLSAYMENKPFNYYKYLIIIIIDFICLGGMLYFKASFEQYLYLILQFIALIFGLVIIKRMPNKTYCDDSHINIAINSLRQDYLSHCFFSVILIDALFNLIIQFYLLNQLPFILVILISIIMVINLFIIIDKSKKYQTKKQKLLQNKINYEYNIYDDDCWKIGLFGPSYYNKADPKTLVTSPIGTQMIFNTARPAYKYFVMAIWSFIIGLLVLIFGYPGYLDLTNQLADLSIENNVIVVSSPFYDVKIDIEDINDISITDDLGAGIRTNGTDAIFFTKGHCHYDKYGDCLVYKANFHHCFIIVETDEATYIINDDNISNTQKIYQEAKELI